MVFAQIAGMPEGWGQGAPCRGEADFAQHIITVKFGIKELLNKEQTGVKELFTDYQPFYTINLLLIKELLQYRKCQNLALVNTRLWKLAKKGEFTYFATYFGILQ